MIEIVDRLAVLTAQRDRDVLDSITLSVGFTAIHAQDAAFGAFERADRAVWCAKRHGRSPVRCNEALFVAGQLDDGQQAGEVELF